MEAMRKLTDEGMRVRVVSMPSWELFDEQPRSYREAVLPPSVPHRLAIEAGAAQGWHRFVGDAGDVLAVERFGASAPGKAVLREYGFTVDNICARARALEGRT
jgi:transketolase